MKNKNIELILSETLNRPIAFHPIFAEIGGGVTAGLFLSQAFYWSKRTTLPGNWFYKSREQWQEETTLTRAEQETARLKLRERGILKEKKEGLPYKIYYWVDHQRIAELIQELVEKRSQSVNQPEPERESASVQESDQQDNKEVESQPGRVQGNDLQERVEISCLEAGKQLTITETTQENTTKNTEQDLEPKPSVFPSHQGDRNNRVTESQLLSSCSPPGRSKNDFPKVQDQDLGSTSKEAEFQRFYDLARKTCQLEDGSEWLDLLQKKVRELMAQGFTAENAVLVDRQWYSVWPGSKPSRPSIKQYYSDFTSLLADCKAKEQAPVVQKPRPVKIDYVQVACDENAAGLLAERNAVGLPPIHCNCRDENGNYLSAHVEGHSSKEYSWLRCHYFKWIGGNKRSFESQCGFEVRAGEIDNLASQPDISPEQCQPKRYQRDEGNLWREDRYFQWKPQSSPSQSEISQSSSELNSFGSFRDVESLINVPNDVRRQFEKEQS